MAEKLFYSMGEVAEMFDVKTSLIRHWDSQFSILKPKRNKKGNRLFSPQDVENLKVIYHLVKERGMTLEGAKKAMKRRAAGGPDSEIKREAELMTRLRHIRALLVEVREDLKTGGEGVVADDDFAPDPADFAAPVVPASAPVVPAAPAPAVSEPSVPAEPSIPAPAPAEPAALVEDPFEPSAPAAPAAPVPAELTAPAEPAAPVLAEDPADSEPSVAGSNPAPRRKAVVKIEPEPAAEDSAAADAPAEKKPRAPRRPRRKADGDDNKELFAFYEQSLF